jgi:hypothetical protein
MGFGGMKINSIKLMLYLMAFGALICLGAAYETSYETNMYQGMTVYEDEPIYAQQYSGTSESAEMYGHHDGPDGHDGGHDGGPDGHHGGYDHHGYYDWLSPGGVYYSSYPSYYYSSWYYPTYTYSYYPQYYYTTPVTYSNWYYSPVVYDPWYAANVYGLGSTTYYYSSSSSWSYHGGFFFGP